MICYLPCIKFKIFTTESKYTKPTELDLAILKFIHRRTKNGSCTIGDLLNFFDEIVNETVLHGVIHKLHTRYLNLGFDGRLSLLKGVEDSLSANNPSALIVQVGEKRGAHSAYFDLVAGTVFLWRPTLLATPIADRNLQLPQEFNQNDYCNTEIVPTRTLLDLVTEKVSCSIQPEGEFYRAESGLPSLEDQELVFFPLLASFSNKRIQLNAADALPHQNMLQITRRVSLLNEQGKLSNLLPAMKGLPASDESKTAAWSRELERATQDHSIRNCYSMIGIAEDLPAWFEEILKRSDSVVITAALIQNVLRANQPLGYRAIANFLVRQGFLTVLFEEDSPPDNFPCFLASKDWINTRLGDQQGAFQPLCVIGDETEEKESDSGFALFTLASLRMIEKSRTEQQNKSLRKNFRQRNDLRGIQLMTRVKPSAGSPSFLATPHEFYFPIVDSPPRLDFLQVVSLGDEARSSLIGYLEGILADYVSTDPEKHPTGRSWYEPLDVSTRIKANAIVRVVSQEETDVLLPELVRHCSSPAQVLIPVGSSLREPIGATLAQANCSIIEVAGLVVPIVRAGNETCVVRTSYATVYVFGEIECVGEMATASP